MPTMIRTAEVKTGTTAQIKADAAAVYARWGISLSDAINIFLAKSIEVGGLPPLICAPRLPRLTDSNATPIAPRWTQTASHSSRETGMTASEAQTYLGTAGRIGRLSPRDAYRVSRALTALCR